MRRPGGVYDLSYSQDMAILRTRFRWTMALFGGVLLMCTPFLAGPVVTNLLNVVAITSISVAGLNLLMGFAGQISIGHAAFMAVGAYTGGILATHFGVTFWLGLPSAGICAALAGILVALPSLRVKGFYLAMATLAVQFIIPWIVINVRPDITGGINALTLPRPKIGSFVLDSQEKWLYVIMPLTFLMLFFAKNLARTRLGRAWVAIRDNDLAAEALGVNLFHYKALAFAASSFYAGVAGCLWAFWAGAASTEPFGLHYSVWLLGMAIIGGLGTTLGSILGAAAIVVLDRIVLISGPIIEPLLPTVTKGTVGASMAPITFGLVLTLFLIFEPRGLAHRWEVIRSWWDHYPFRY